MSETLLQLLVFKHATGDVVIQMEVGFLRLVFTMDGMSGGIIHAGAGKVHTLGKCSNIREDIDKAVAEQFGRKPEPPYIERSRLGLHVFVVDDKIAPRCLSADEYAALCKIAGKELPVVDASESQPTSVWTQVFPPELIWEDVIDIRHPEWVNGVQYVLGIKHPFVVVAE